MITTRIFFSLSLLMMALLAASEVEAQRDPFEVNLAWMGETYRSGYDSIEDAIEVFDAEGLNAILPDEFDADDGDPLTGTINLRGVEITGDYKEYDAAAGELELVIEIPELDGFRRVFTGEGDSIEEARNNLEAALEDFFEDEVLGGDAPENPEDIVGSAGDGLLTQILQKAISVTAIDPVAGNPKSLMGKMTRAGFDAGTHIDSVIGGGFGIGAYWENYSSDGYEADLATLPLRWAFEFSDPKMKLIIDLPLSYTDLDGAESYDLLFNFAFRYPLDFILRDMSITPMAGIGAAGSLDLGAGAVLYSFGLAANNDFIFADPLSRFIGLGFGGKWRITLGHAFAYYKSVPLEISDFNVDYDLSNTMQRHGTGLEISFLQNFVLGTSLSYTYYRGSDLYVDRHFDISISLARNFSSQRDNLRLTAVWTKGDGNDYEGFNLRLIYGF